MRITVPTAIRLLTLGCCLFAAAQTHAAEPMVRRLAPTEPVFRGKDGSYFCKHPKGGKGQIVGTVDGDALKELLKPGQSRQAGALIEDYIASIEGQPYDRHNHELLCA